MDRHRKRKQARKVDQSSNSSAVLLNLPSHILMEIISRLPITTLMAIRLVSKSLLNLVSEPYFKELHSTRAPTELFLRRNHSRQEDLSLSLTLYLAEPAFIDHYSTDVDIKFKLVFDLPRFSVSLKNAVNFRATKTELTLVNSCHGLVCYCGPNTNCFAVICNPITGEYVTVPRPDVKMYATASRPDVKCRVIAYGLGFSPKDNRFKLMRLFWLKNVDIDPVICEVYTFGESGSWKSVANDCPQGRLPGNPTFYAGVLHWCMSEDIITFDFSTEQFGKLVTPPLMLDMSSYDRIWSLRVSVCGGYLYITGCVGHYVEVWVMKEYGQDSWIEAFSIRKDNDRTDYRFEYVPINYLPNGKMLMFHNSRDIVCCDPDTGSVERIGELYPGYEAASIRPSLLSLKVMLGDNVTAHNAKSAPVDPYREEMPMLPGWWSSSASSYPSP